MDSLAGSLAENIQMVSIQFVPFVMAVVFHEFAHGFVAARFGDTTARDQGRLTLNPIPHIDPVGTILFPLINMLTGMNILFGWAKPVPINPARFRKYRPGLFWVSFAGPGMNFILAFLSALVFCALLRWMPHEFFLFEPLVGMTRVGITLNFALGIFNLMPLPPMDGSKMIQSFLSYEATRKYEMVARYSFWILMALLISGALRVLSYPIQFLSNLTLWVASLIIGINGA
jgi:Zn-dependent protease